MKKSSKPPIVRARLHKENPFCCYCGIKTILLETYPIGGRIIESDVATIEHLYDKFDKRRKDRTIKKRLAIACNDCNQSRAAKRIKENLDEHQYRSFIGAFKYRNFKKEFEIQLIYRDFDYFDRF